MTRSQRGVNLRGEFCADVAREKKIAHAGTNNHRIDVKHFITLSSLWATSNDLVCEAEGTPDGFFFQ